MQPPRITPFRVGFVLAALALCLAAPAHAQAPARSTPGLVLNIDGRYATCDVIRFTPDGSRLMAVGDDKVVRRWVVLDDRFGPNPLSPLRWPTFREQRGNIYALALSPDADADSLAIGGHGLKTGMIFVL